MTEQRRRGIIASLMICLVFPAVLLWAYLVLRVETVDVRTALQLTEETSTSITMQLKLEQLPDDEAYDLMLETKGAAVAVTMGERTLYEYGEELAAQGKTLGRLYAQVHLPTEAVSGTLTIRLTQVDGYDQPKLKQAVLCPRRDSGRFYLMNRNAGLPLALILMAMAFCIPVFLLLGTERSLLAEGCYFGLILLCYAVLLLDRGGHYLVFTAAREQWTLLYYLARDLLPAFCLLYFYTMGKSFALRRLLLGAAICNLLFCLTQMVLQLTGIAKLSDLEPVYLGLLALNVLVAGCSLVLSLRQKRLRSIQRRILIAAGICCANAVLWQLLFFRDGNGALRSFFDPLSIGAGFLFYTLCALYFRTADRIQRNADEDQRQLTALRETEQEAIFTAGIARTLAQTYLTIYSVDVETGGYSVFFQDAEAEGYLPTESGEDFFTAIESRVSELIFAEDQDYFRQMTSKEAVLAGTEEGKRHAVIYRINGHCGTPIYHKLRATRQSVDGRDRILIGVRDIDEAMRMEREHEDRHASMLQKQANYMQAILASAVGYLEANLTQDRIVTQSWTDQFASDAPESVNAGKVLRYSDFIQICAKQLISEHQNDYLRTMERNNLITGFVLNNKRASVSYSFPGADGKKRHCRQVSYLYRDHASEDIMSLHVIYDLTEQQRKEKERSELEAALQMSRIRVFTGQMQPHFLYNALGSIQEVVLEDPVYASELLGDFTVHLRASIRAMSNDDPISFVQELENIRAYVHIEQMRFGKKLRVCYDIQATDFPVSPLSIQPMVENAIRHGIYERGAAGGTVTVRSREMQDCWVVEVEDDGVGFDVKKMQTELEQGLRDSTGLTNLQFRLKKVLSAKVLVESVPGEGTKVTVTIPKETEEKHESNYS